MMVLYCQKNSFDAKTSLFLYCSRKVFFHSTICVATFLLIDVLQQNKHLYQGDNPTVIANASLLQIVSQILDFGWQWNNFEVLRC